MYQVQSMKKKWSEADKMIQRHMKEGFMFQFTDL